MPPPTSTSPILVILSPPRCSSTALARAFWEHTWFRWYLHEPFDRQYHRGETDVVLTPTTGRALDLCSVTRRPRPAASGLVVKEIAFQAGARLPELIATATLPVVFLIRDPRLSIASRMAQRTAGRQPPEYPPAESGWRALDDAVRFAREQGVHHVIVDSTRLRSDPPAELTDLCRRLGLPFQRGMLRWPSVDGLVLGGLGAEQRHWYHRVLHSTGLAPPAETVPPVSAFPSPAMRQHVRESLAIYRRLQSWAGRD